MAAITQLNPLATYDAVVNLNQNVFWKRVWNVALAVTAIAFIALGVFVISYTSIVWPAHAPLVTLMVLAGGLPLSAKVLQNLWNRVEYYQGEERYDRQLKQAVSEVHTDQLSSLLNKIGFSTKASETVQKNLLARYTMLEKQVQNLRASADIGEEVELFVGDRVVKIRPADYQIAKVDFEDPMQVEIFEALQSHQLKRERLLQVAALTKLKAAYILHLIQSPEDLRTYQDFIKLTASSHTQHVIAEQVGDPSAHVLAKAAGKTYARSQILATDTAKLAKNIFGLKLNWF